MPSSRQTPRNVSWMTWMAENCPLYQSYTKGVSTRASWASNTARSAGSGSWLASHRSTASARSS